MLKRLLAAFSLLAFSSCYFRGTPVTTPMHAEAFRIAEDANGKVFVAVDDSVRRYTNVNGRVTLDTDASWDLNLGWIVDLSPTERANEVWVLVTGHNNPDVIHRYRFGTSSTDKTLTALVLPSIADDFHEIRSIAAGPNDTLYMVGGHNTRGNVIARCTVRNGVCTDFLYTDRRGDGPGEFSGSTTVAVDMQTGDVYMNDPNYDLQLYTPNLQPTNIDVVTSRGLGDTEERVNIAAEEGFVVLAGHTRLDSYVRTATGLQYYDTRFTPPLPPNTVGVTQNVLAAGKRTSTECGYLWNLRVNSGTRNNVVNLDYHRIGSLLCP